GPRHPDLPGGDPRAARPAQALSARHRRALRRPRPAGRPRRPQFRPVLEPAKLYQEAGHDHAGIPAADPAGAEPQGLHGGAGGADGRREQAPGRSRPPYASTASISKVNTSTGWRTPRSSRAPRLRQRVGSASASTNRPLAMSGTPSGSQSASSRLASFTA